MPTTCAHTPEEARRRASRRWMLLTGILLGLAAAHLFRPAQAQSGGPVASVARASGTANAAPDASGTTGAARASHGTLVNDLLVGLICVLVAAKLAGEFFERIGQPPVLGELVAGIVLGNLGLVGVHALDYLRGNEVIFFLSEVGVILLLFEVGLESNLAEMQRLGLASLLVATLGVLATLVVGWGVARLFLPHSSWMTHLFLGGTLCATSVGITARVLRDLGQVQRTEAQIILGAAVIDDVIGLVVLAVVTGLITASANGGAPQPEAILLTIVKSAGFLVGAVVVGSRLSRVLFKLASFLSAQHVLLVTSLGFCFLLARLSAAIGLAPIVGAFAAGLILEPADYQDFRERGEHRIEDVLRPISGFLVPIFFVVAGMHVDLAALAQPQALGLAAALLVAAIVGKQACALGVRDRGLDRLSVGIGMVPRGEVGLIFANAGTTLLVMAPGGHREPLVTATSFAALVIAVIATALITPPLLHWSLTRSTPRPAPEAA